MGAEEGCPGECASCPSRDSCEDERAKALRRELERLKNRMARVKHKLVVISGKGGVGKTMVAVNLAVALAMRGHEVGILDADITGPCVPKMLGLSGSRLVAGPPGIFPVVGPLGVRVVSMDFLLPDEESPVIWRGPLKAVAIRQFLADIVWGPLDYLIVDLPPGTGDEPLTIMQLLPDMDGAIIVTIPSEVSQVVVKKAITFARKLNVPVVGVIENMSGFTCPKCGTYVPIFMEGGGERMARRMGVPFLGRIPIDPRIAEASDAGEPFVVKHKDSPAAKAFLKIAEKIEAFCERRARLKESVELSEGRRGESS